MVKIFYIIAFRILTVYWFIFRPKTKGVKCVLENQGKILFIKNTYSEKNLWNLPGGGIKKNETLEEAIKREIKEETGIKISNLINIGNYLNNRNYKRDTVYCYHSKTEEENILINKNEILEARWFQKEEIPKNLTQSTKDILELLKNYR